MEVKASFLAVQSLNQRSGDAIRHLAHPYYNNAATDEMNRGITQYNKR